MIEILIEKDILNASYWENFKYAKDLSFLYPPDHPKRVNLQNELNDISKRLEILNKKIKSLEK